MPLQGIAVVAVSGFAMLLLQLLFKDVSNLVIRGIAVVAVSGFAMLLLQLLFKDVSNLVILGISDVIPALNPVLAQNLKQTQAPPTTHIHYDCIFAL